MELALIKQVPGTGNPLLCNTLLKVTLLWNLWFPQMNYVIQEHRLGKKSYGSTQNRYNFDFTSWSKPDFVTLVLPKQCYLLGQKINLLAVSENARFDRDCDQSHLIGNLSFNFIQICASQLDTHFPFSADASCRFTLECVLFLVTYIDEMLVLYTHSTQNVRVCQM